MPTRRTGTAPVDGPPLETIEPLSGSVASSVDLARQLQSLGLYKDWISSGNAADKPSAAITNRLYICLDTSPKQLWFDNGTSWYQLI